MTGDQSKDASAGWAGAEATSAKWEALAVQADGLAFSIRQGASAMVLGSLIATLTADFKAAIGLGVSSGER